MGDRTCHQVYVYDCPKDQVRAVQEVLEGYFWEQGPRGGRISACEPYLASEITCGTSDEIAAKLMKAAPGASFVLWEDPKYEWLGSVSAYTPELGVFSAECDANGQPVIHYQTAAQVITEAAGAGADVLAAFARAMGRPWLDEWGTARDAEAERRKARLEERWRKYAIKFVLDTENLLEATDANLKAVLSGCARVPEAYEYRDIRRHVDLYRAERAAEAAGEEQHP